MGRKCCTLDSFMCSISLRDGSLMIAIIMIVVSILRLVFAVTSICYDRNEAWFALLVEIINIPLAFLLLIAILKEKVKLLCAWVTNTLVVALANFAYGCLIIVAVANVSDGVASISMAVVQVCFAVVVRSFALTICPHASRTIHFTL
nr:uncharacterized protein LOC113815233 isoform X1 [Penaeus vannamei]XP_027223116.1 uncharacterized protein LOC113815233 isoform X1 [Penaeus vannamei]XP_027223122.1 uncharacterized protein LOC113815233 isoform X1 [Penaeus vannamei]